MVNDLEGIVGSILSFFILIIFLSAIIPVFTSLSSFDTKQQEINQLNEKISELNSMLASKEVQISELQSMLFSTNKTLGEKDDIISNLTVQLKQRDLIIDNLTEELSYLEEKQYLQDINNFYYNISNYFEKIENKFFPIEVSISLISITLFAVILKEFSVISWLKTVWKRKNKEVKNNEKKD